MLFENIIDDIEIWATRKDLDTEQRRKLVLLLQLCLAFEDGKRSIFEYIFDLKNELQDKLGPNNEVKFTKKL